MNNICFRCTVNQTIDFLNDRLVQAISPLQKKIMYLALPILAGIAYFAITRCIKRVVNYWKENSSNLLLQQEKWIEEIGAQMKKNIVDHMNRQLEQDRTFQCESAIGFVNIRFKKGNIRQQYVFNSQTGSALTINEFSNNIDKALNVIKKDLNKNLGSPDKFSWLVIQKGSHHFLKMEGSMGNIIQDDPIPNNIPSNVSVLTGLTNELLEKHLQIGLNSLGKDMDIPEGTIYIQEGEFVPGQYYRDINT